jgi:hypothetical protein
MSPVRLGKAEKTDTGEIQRPFSGFSKVEIGKTVLHGVAVTQGELIVTEMIVPYSEGLAHRGVFSVGYDTDDDAQEVVQDEELVSAHLAMAITRFKAVDKADRVTQEMLEEI